MSQAGIINFKGGGTGNVQTLTGNTGGAVPPTGNNINVVGTGSILVTGNPATSTLTISSSGMAFNYVSVNHTTGSPYVVTSTDYYISCDSVSGTITIDLPNAPVTNRLFIIKDRTGGASTSNISVTTVGGSVTIDGQTTYTIAGNYGAIQLLFNGTSYEVY